MRNQMQDSRQPKEFEEKIVQVNRVSKKTKGGNKAGFSVLMVVGDKKGQVGVGLGKAGDVVGAIKKGIKKAKKKMITIPLDGTTVPFSITAKKGAGIVLLKPAPKGSGVIAGGPVRAVVEAAGIRDISAKIMGSQNQSSSVYATFEALIQIKKIVEIKGIKLRSIADIEKEEQEKLKEMQAKAKAASKHDAPEAKAAPKKEATKEPKKEKAAAQPAAAKSEKSAKKAKAA
jgi:small subunit ribosomal protein S5